MPPTTVYLIFIGTLFLLILLYGIFIYIKFSGLKKKMQSSLYKIDQKFEEMVKLVKLMKNDLRRHISADDEIFSKFSNIIAQEFLRLSIKERIDFGKNLKGLFQNLTEISSNSPDITKDNSFMKIKEQLHDLEKEIESSKIFYNEVALKNKKLLSSFPSFLIGLMFSFRRAELFDANN